MQCTALSFCTASNLDNYLSVKLYVKMYGCYVTLHCSMKSNILQSFLWGGSDANRDCNREGWGG